MATKRWWSVHTHSRFSVLDGMAEVEELAAKAHDLGYPALGLTDHGNMAGSFRLYRQCKERGMLPFPGMEAYVVSDVRDREAERYHLTMLGLNYDGYKAMVALSSLAHEREHFYRKPLLDYADLAEAWEAGLTKHLFVSTGCYFGEVAQTLVHKGREPAMAKLKMLATWFPRLAVEIQHHHTDHGDGWNDTKLAHELWAMAVEAGLPVIVAGDAHYCDSSHRDAHTLMKEIAYRSAPDAGDVGFPGDSYHLASGLWVRDHFATDGTLQRVWNASLDTLADIVEHHEVDIPALNTYQFRMPDMGADPDGRLARLCHDRYKALTEDWPSKRSKGYLERMTTELEVIAETGYSAYFLLTEDVVRWATEHNIRVMARGSANGSLVCFLLGITQVDPIEWDLLFEAFLTRDRSSPPDIDLDIDRLRRAEVIEYVKSRFRTIQLGSWGKLGMDEETGKGSLIRRFQGWMDRQGTPNAYAWGVDAIARNFPEKWQALQVLEEIAPVEKAGVHAAGSAIDPDGLLHEIVPTMLIASSGTTVTQMEMDDVESAGFVKIDLLGLRTITSVARTLELIGVDWTWYDDIPIDDRGAMRVVRDAQYDSGLFQLEGGAACRGLRQLKPRYTREVIDAMALFRPACINSGMTDLYLARRENPLLITYPHEVTEEALKPTLGVPLFSEQVLQICWALGLDTETTQRIVKAMKVKHGKAGMSEASSRAFRESQDTFADAGRSAGLDDSAIAELWSLIEGFQAYGFKKAHATAYGLLAYKTAYLKAHHQRAFMAALLEVVAVAQPEKVAAYVSECHRLGITIWPPHVNFSGPSWTLHDEAIQRGLVDIKGVGMRAAQAIVDAARSAPFGDVQDLINRTPARLVTGGKEWESKGELRGVLKALQDAGALKGLV